MAEVKTTSAPKPVSKDAMSKKPVSKIDTSSLAGDLKSPEQGNLDVATLKADEKGQGSWSGLSKNKKQAIRATRRGHRAGGFEDGFDGSK